MSDLPERVAEMSHILSLPLVNREKIIQSQQALSGLNLTALSKNTRGAFESNLVKNNHILRQYDIQTWEDYKQISAEDLHAMLDNVTLLHQKLLALIRAGKYLARRA